MKEPVVYQDLSKIENQMGVFPADNSIMLDEQWAIENRESYCNKLIGKHTDFLKSMRNKLPTPKVKSHIENFIQKTDDDKERLQLGFLKFELDYLIDLRDRIYILPLYLRELGEITSELLDEGDLKLTHAQKIVLLDRLGFFNLIQEKLNLSNQAKLLAVIFNNDVANNRYYLTYLSAKIKDVPLSQDKYFCKNPLNIKVVDRFLQILGF